MTEHTARLAPRITIGMLKGACRDQRAIFKAEWPQGADVTIENVRRAQELGLSLAWGERWFTPLARKAYDEARVPALKAYNEARAPARKAYDEARVPAMKAYNEALDQAWKVYNEATAQAWKAYNEARVPALKAYDEARVPAWKAYAETSAQAWVAAYLQTAAERDELALAAQALYDQHTELLEKRPWVETAIAREAAPKRVVVPQEGTE